MNKPTKPLLFNKQAFFKDLGYTPHPGQLEVHRSKASRRVVACGVRWGKTTCAAMEGLAAAMEPRTRSVGWVAAPTYDLSEKVFREMVILAVEHFPHQVLSVKNHEHKLVLRNLGGGLSEVRGKSADNPVSLLGEGLDWLVIDEAARLKPAIWESYLSQRLLDKKGWALLISTPKGKGWFYELYRRGQQGDADHASWNAPSCQNPLLDRALIEVEKERLPGRVWAQEYGGEFVEGSGAVFRNVRECAKGDLQSPEAHESYWGGLDLAKVEDYTVLVLINQRREVVFVDRFHRLDWSVQVARLQGASQRYRNANLLVDSTGAGEPILENLRRANVNCTGYTLTAGSKSNLITNLALLLEQKKIVLPRPALWPEGVEELEAFQYSVSDAGNTKTGAPSGTHDDCVIALALAAWQVRNADRQYRIYSLASFEEELYNDLWPWPERRWRGDPPPADWFR